MYPIKAHTISTSGRESYTLTYASGTIEGWRTRSVFNPDLYYGGIEVHSKTPMYEGQVDPFMNCELTGGDCYPDGSSLAYERDIKDLFDVTAPDEMYAELARWAAIYLNIDTVDTNKNTL